MKSSRSIRQRLTYVSSRQKADLPAIFESLNDDTLTTVLEFVGDKSYGSFGGTNKQCKGVYVTTKGMTKKTFLYGYAPLSVIQVRIERATISDRELFERVGKGVVLYNRRDVFEWALKEQKKSVLSGICVVAAEEGRIDIMEEVLNNIEDEDDKQDVFLLVDGGAGRCGKLEVLNWLEMKGLSIDKEGCARGAAYGGQIHILKWLREERGLQLHGVLYSSASYGDQLHVLKWLREQELDWHRFTFQDAAKYGNLDILQWLHDEGCPWSDDDLIYYADALKPEVVDWLRSNGYSSRIL